VKAEEKIQTQTRILVKKDEGIKQNKEEIKEMSEEIKRQKEKIKQLKATNKTVMKDLAKASALLDLRSADNIKTPAP
jgi:predicted RNase H-like nuclease (RuvC/YqgF family)